ALDEFKVDESGAVLRFTVTLPDAWTDEVKEAMRDDGLRFRIYLDETETDAFRTRTVSELEENGYTVQYSSCVLPIRDWQSVGKISIVPDVINASEAQTHPLTYYDLESGETASYYSLGTNYSWEWPEHSELSRLADITYEHTLLQELALSFTVNENPIEAEPVVWAERPFVIYEELFEENKADGFYDRDYDHADWPKYRASLITTSFEGTTFTLTRLRFRETGVEMELHIKLPEAWSVEQKQSFYSTNVGVRIIVTAIKKNGRQIFRALSPGGINKTGTPNLENYLTEDFGDVYLYTRTCFAMGYEDWKEVDRLIIVPRYDTYTAVGDDSNPTPLSEEPIVSNESFNARSCWNETLEEFTITVDFDETMFDAGL
ncbi:MAG: hypothetical protein Q4C01_06620, partial [Clostridia bacterium]|nr:hypothetical protein [Clostridia bacterium]